MLLYHDGLEVCNSLGINEGTHKIDMFYYSLVNIDPKFRSKHTAVGLLTIHKQPPEVFCKKRYS